MAKLSPLIYVGAGTIVTIVSILVGEKFKLFLYIGIGFLVFGAVSAFIGAMRYQSERKAKDAGAKRNASNSQRYPNHMRGGGVQGGFSAQAQMPQRQGPTHQQRSAPLRFCSRCGTMVRPTDFFCSRCGSRLG